MLPGPTEPSGTRTIGARTEHIEIDMQGDANAEVDWIEHLGDQNHLHLKVGNRKLTTLANPHVPISAGDRLRLTLKQPLYFGATGERLR